MSTVVPRLSVRCNTVLLSASLAANSAMMQLSAAVASLTLVLVLDVEGLLGLGPAIVLACGAAAAVPAGRLMDRVGRVPVLAGGFAVGAAGCGLAALGSAAGSAPLVLLGLACVGTANAAALLARTAAGAPARRARGIAFVLFGSVFGAILGPAVFGPMLSGHHELDGDALAPLWLAAGGIVLVGLLLVACVRPDPAGSRSCWRGMQVRRTAPALRAGRASRRSGTKRCPPVPLRRCASCWAVRASSPPCSPHRRASR